MSRLWLLALAGCSIEHQLSDPPKVPPADPPGEDENPEGNPPDWQNCFQGWRAQYFNLAIHDDFVDPRPLDDPAPLTPDGFDYWSKPLFDEQYDPTLDFGQNWWP